MRYLYQQLLAFVMVIVIILLTIGISFTQMTRQTVEENNYQQLFSYAESVAETTDLLHEETDTNANIQQSLLITEEVLNQQAVNFLFISADEEIIYPQTSEQALNFKISDSQWRALENGQRQQKTANQDVFGQPNPTSYAMVPYNLAGAFYGALVVTQPAQNVEDSVQVITLNLLRGFMISVVIALIISYIFASIQVRRIQRMKKATQEVANGNFDIQLPVKNKDEFDELAQAFNSMANSLKMSQEEIEHQEELRKQFMADASHEMRTPLTTINGLLEGLEYHAIPENQKEKAIQLMKNETNRLIRLVNENLDYEKIRTSQITMMIQKFDATETLQNILTQLNAKAEAQHDELILETQEAVMIYADYDRFVQVMVNIIQNAIQFTEDGQIVIRVKKGYLETIVEIADTGIGMDPTHLENIWDRYYKVDPSRKNKKFGESGLGLPIVQQLVRLHNGKIDVQSQIGQGTTFKISFPDVDLTP
ncbi:MAG: ATP-binding protein [Enterococcus sp.]